MSENSMWSRVIGLPLHWQIVAALVLAALVAWPSTPETMIFGASLVGILDFFGGLFINALKMVVVPLILSSIIVGVGNMVSGGAFGRVGGKTVAFYVMTGFFAIFTGLVLVNVWRPARRSPPRPCATPCRTRPASWRAWKAAAWRISSA